MTAITFKLLFSAALIVVVGTNAQAQQPAPSSAIAAANALFNKSDWEKAVSAYQRITTDEPANGLAWQNLGESLLQLKRYDDALRAFAKAQELKFRPLVNIVNAARVHAEKGDRTQTLALLTSLMTAGQGARMRPVILSSTEFARYNNDAQYKSLIESMAPCRDPVFRQFDFWVGNWEVHDPANNVVGKNRVTLQQSGCLIVENWESAQGGQSGSSFNFYDIRDQKWHQVYIDNSGNAGAFPAMAGEVKDGKMVLMTNEKINPVARWTWYAVTPDRVRQMAEQSTDGQKTWQVTWDSFYVRKSPAAKP